jgi:hypothetical protein
VKGTNNLYIQSLLCMLEEVEVNNNNVPLDAFNNKFGDDKVE